MGSASDQATYSRLLMNSFYNRFLSSAEKYPDHIAVELQLASPRTEVVSFTYSELRNMAESVALWLAQNEIKPGDRCALLAANSPRWVAAYLGVIASGGVAVPLDTAFNSAQVSKLLADSGSSLFFCDAAHLSVAQSAVHATASTNQAVRLVLLERAPDAENGTPTLDEILAHPADNYYAFESQPDDLAVILYTSGTTSDPKGVRLTHANLAAEAEAVFGLLRVDATDAILGVLPLFHALAQMANLLLPYSVGARVVYLEQLNTTELLRGLREREVTLFCCVPQFFYLIHERVMKEVKQRGTLQQLAFRLLMKTATIGRALGLNLGKLAFSKIHLALGPRMRYLITGGSRFDPQIGRDLEALGFDILQAYGLTECSGGATVSPLGDHFIGAVGNPLPGVEVQIVPSSLPDLPAQNGSSATYNVGEVAIRGGIVMQGYYNRPDATAEVLKNGWLHTGDLGYLDPAGNLFITGRQKDVIVLSSGKNIYPEEIEAHYLASPWIKEICVMGLESRPGEPFSERLHAVIVPDFDLLREKKIVNTKEVLRFDIENLSAQIAAPKRILSYDIWQQDLPRTTTRKLKRFEILKLVRERLSEQQTEGALSASSGDSSASRTPQPLTAAESAWLAQPDVARAMKVVRAAAKKPHQVHPNDNLELDLGLDSMERVELVVALEHELNAAADSAAISNVYTVRELIDTVIAGVGAISSGAGRSRGWAEVLASDPTEPEVLAIAEDRPIASRLWFAFRLLVGPLLRILFRVQISGLEKLPQKGPFILSPNHQSFVDAPVLIAQLPYRILKDLFYVGTSEIFTGPLMLRLARSLKLVPVDPDANLVPAMRAGAFGLRRGKILVLYPEGERSIDGEPKTFKKGAAILAIHQKVPIYPVALEGFHDVWPRGHGFRGFHKLRITIGDAIMPPQNDANPELAYETLTTELRSRVFEMWQPLHQQNVSSSAIAAPHRPLRP